MRRAKASATPPQGVLGTAGHLQQQSQSDGDAPPITKSQAQVPATAVPAASTKSAGASSKQLMGVLPSILSGLICGLVLLSLMNLFEVLWNTLYVVFQWPGDERREVTLLALQERAKGNGQQGNLLGVPQNIA